MKKLIKLRAKVTCLKIQKWKATGPDFEPSSFRLQSPYSPPGLVGRNMLAVKKGKEDSQAAETAKYNRKEQTIMH